MSNPHSVDRQIEAGALLEKVFTLIGYMGLRICLEQDGKNVKGNFPPIYEVDIDNVIKTCAEIKSEIDDILVMFGQKSKVE